VWNDPRSESNHLILFFFFYNFYIISRPWRLTFTGHPLFDTFLLPPPLPPQPMAGKINGADVTDILMRTVQPRTSCDPKRTSSSNHITTTTLFFFLVPLFLAANLDV
jgi:hypothetical protein